MVRVSGERVVEKFETMIGSNVYEAKLRHLTDQDGEDLWQFAFAQCHIVVREADAFDCCTVYPEASRCRRK